MQKHVSYWHRHQHISPVGSVPGLMVFHQLSSYRGMVFNKSQHVPWVMVYVVYALWWCLVVYFMAAAPVRPTHLKWLGKLTSHLSCCFPFRILDITKAEEDATAEVHAKQNFMHHSEMRTFCTSVPLCVAGPICPQSIHWDFPLPLHWLEDQPVLYQQADHSQLKRLLTMMYPCWLTCFCHVRRKKTKLCIVQGSLTYIVSCLLYSVLTVLGCISTVSSVIHRQFRQYHVL